jgi:hypothetical protein
MRYRNPFHVFSAITVELQIPGPYFKVTYILTLIVVKEVADFLNYSATERRRYALFLLLALAVDFSHVRVYYEYVMQWCWGFISFHINP